MIVCSDLLRGRSSLDDLEQSVEDTFGVISDISLTETVANSRESQPSSDCIRKCQRANAQESTILLDEEDTFDRESGVSVNNESRILKMRDEERENRE